MKKNVVWGLAIIFIAAAIIVNKMDVFGGINIVKYVITAGLIAIALDGGMNYRWFQMCLPLAVIYSQYDHLVPDRFHIPVGVAFLAAVLVSIGLGFIFPAKHRSMNITYTDENGNRITGPKPYKDTGEQKISGDYPTIDNSIGSTTRYVDSPCLKGAVIDNGLGDCSVYFDNAVPDSNDMYFTIDNGLGHTTAYFPNTWRLSLKEDNGLGSINVVGTPSTDPAAPVAHVNVDNGLGVVDLIFK